ncbi:hypothetical protein SDJN02_13197, partial [Cucurbita argyrosperma subsp. argyrosperma]
MYVIFWNLLIDGEKVTNITEEIRKNDPKHPERKFQFEIQKKIPSGSCLDSELLQPLEQS